MAVDLVADSLPVELIPQFTDVVSNVHGLAAGKIGDARNTQAPVARSARSTLLYGNDDAERRPARPSRTSARRSHMANDTVYVDSVAGWARGPGARCAARSRSANWREPAFNLYLTSSGAELLNNDHGKRSRRCGARAQRAVPTSVSERGGRRSRRA